MYPSNMQIGAWAVSGLVSFFCIWAWKTTADVYTPSTRPYRGIGELSYPFPRSHRSGYLLRKDLHFQKKINLSTSLAGQAVGIKEVDGGIWLVTFMDYDLSYIDLEEKNPAALKQPFWP
jgi:hypothetical protein